MSGGFDHFKLERFIRCDGCASLLELEAGNWSVDENAADLGAVIIETPKLTRMEKHILHAWFSLTQGISAHPAELKKLVRLINRRKSLGRR
ncbi:hypothetical protein QCD70_04110 [Agreia sp. PsM10]|uniref:hypothetical protein n=1 Tax=Agreia sp. PsM10 TaxID=3030533 RepID=UPI00263ACCE8|nr:hypothetical protein [Agreia sp. PsM10]MDN4639421.1 hypothetical protein [Agreia sp. PsM10]